MEGRAGAGRRLLAVLLWGVAIAGLVAALALEAHVRASGRDGLATDPSEAYVYGAAMVSCASVGLVVAVRRHKHPVGWLFLLLGVWLAVGGAGDAYALDRAVVGGNRSAVPAFALVAGKASFIAWFGLLAAILHLTPTGQTLGPRWRVALWCSSVATVVAIGAKTVQDTAFEAPFASVHNPLAVRAAAPAVDAVAGIAITLTVVGLLIGAVSIVVRVRRSDREERRPLRWMAVVVIPLPLFVATSIVASFADLPVLRTVATGGLVALIPIATGLSVQLYRLYDIDRILSAATAYVLSTVALLAVFVTVTATLGRALGGIVDDSTVPVAVATVITVSIALPVLRSLQDLVDRRFDRRRYNAYRMVREHLGQARPSRSLEATLANAVGAPTLEVAYWLPQQERWATADGKRATAEPDDIEVARNGAPVARLRLGAAAVDRRLASGLATEAVAELDNIRLRAEVGAQLEEVRGSRARIVAAQAAERHRIERNLHDGAQQRLLALAMQLRATDVGGDLTTDATLLDHAIEQLGAAVQDLRELANGLHPTVLDDAGLAGALDDLAGRTPIPVHLDLARQRLPPTVEEALWFVATESVANAVKHSRARSMRIELQTTGVTATLRCADDGVGAADPNGAGLRGIADRVEAVGGHLRVSSVARTGTTIEAIVPCES